MGAIYEMASSLPAHRGTTTDAVLDVAFPRLNPGGLETEGGIRTVLPARTRSPGPVFPGKRNTDIGRHRPRAGRIPDAVAHFGLQPSGHGARPARVRSGLAIRRSHIRMASLRVNSGRRRQAQRQAKARGPWHHAKRGGGGPFTETVHAMCQQRPEPELGGKPGLPV